MDDLPLSGTAIDTSSPSRSWKGLFGLLLFVLISLVPLLVPGSEGSAGALTAADALAADHRLLSASAGYEFAATKPRGTPRAQSLLGDVLLRRGQPQEAANALKLAIAGGAYDRKTLINLAQAFEESEDAESSLSTLRQELAIRPGDVEAWASLVETAAKLGQRPEEIRQRLVGAVPPSAAGRDGQRASYLAAACLLDPSSPSASAFLDIAAQGPDASFAEAAHDLSDAARLPTGAERQLGIANALLGQGLLGPALPFLDTELSAGRAEAERQALLGYILMKTGKISAAEEAFGKSQQMDPELRDGQLLMGSLLRAEGKAEQAIPLLESAARQTPPNPAAYVELANALVDVGDYGTAEQALGIAVKADPSNGDLHLLVADFYVSRQYRIEKALPEAKEAVRILGRTPATLGTLGWAQYLSGNAQEALASISEAVGKAAESPMLRYRLGSIYEDLGRRTEARQQYMMVKELDGPGAFWKRAQAALDGL